MVTGLPVWDVHTDTTYFLMQTFIPNHSSVCFNVKCSDFSKVLNLCSSCLRVAACVGGCVDKAPIYFVTPSRGLLDGETPSSEAGEGAHAGKNRPIN